MKLVNILFVAAAILSTVACKTAGADQGLEGSEVKTSPLNVEAVCENAASPNSYQFIKYSDYSGWLSQPQIGDTQMTAVTVGRDYSGRIGTMTLHVVYDKLNRRAQVFQNFGTFMNLLGTLYCQ